MDWRATSVVPLVVLLVFSAAPGGVVAGPVEDLEEDLPPGDYLLGPDALDGSWGATANDTSVHIQKSWERELSAGENLTVYLAWEEVATDPISSASGSEANLFNYSVYIDGELHSHWRWLNRSRDLSGSSGGEVEMFYPENGEYRIVLTGKQGLTKYSISLEEST